MAKGNKTRVTGGQIMGFIALLMVVVLVVVWSIGSNGFTNNNPAKWDWWQSESKDNPAEGGDNVTPTDEGILMFKPITTVDSPVALAAETAAGSNTATLTATLVPENAFYYSASWRSSSNALTVTKDEEDPLKATVELTGTLTETAQITCVVESFKTVTATCTVDYLDTSVSVGFKEIVSTNDKYPNPSADNIYACAFGTTYSFSVEDYSSDKSTVQGTNVITKVVLMRHPSLSSTSMESTINNKLKISETGWMKDAKLTLYENTVSGSETFIFPDTLEELIGKPSSVSSDYLAHAFYSSYGSSRNKADGFIIGVSYQIRYNDIVYKSGSQVYGIKFVPESYLTGVDGVEITPGGGVVVTN